MPLVSICMPAFNAERFIAEAIESVLLQTHRNLELIIVNDGSHDQTFQVANKFAQADKRVRLYSHEVNQGLTGARNRTLHEARGSYIAMADADDVSDPHRIERQLDFLTKHPEVGAVGSDVSFLEAGGRQTPHQTLYQDDATIRFQMLLLPCFWNPTTIYRHEVLVTTGGFSARFDGGGEDYELWSRMLPVTRFHNLPEKLVGYRVYGQSVSASPSGRCLDNVLMVSASLLSAYLQTSVSVVDRKALYDFLNCGGMMPDPCRSALNLAIAIWRTAYRLEPHQVLASTRRDFARAAWENARYMVFKDRSLSWDLTRAAIQWNRSLLTNRQLPSHLVRLGIGEKVGIWKRTLRGRNQG